MKEIVLTLILTLAAVNVKANNRPIKLTNTKKPIKLQYIIEFSGCKVKKVIYFDKNTKQKRFKKVEPSVYNI